MKKAAIRYAEILEAGAWVTHQEQEEIAKLLRKLAMIDDPEEFAWQQLERKQNKKPRQFTQRMALQIAYNALSAIDRQTPYPIAKHALMCINGVLSSPEQDWEAIAADQAMTIKMLHIDDDDIQEYKKPWVGLTDVEIKEILDCGRGGLIDIKKVEQMLKERNR